MRYALILCAVCLVACGNRCTTKQQHEVVPVPVRYGYRIVNSYPHDTEAYTQGLFWHEGTLYESTGDSDWPHGNENSSKLRRVELTTGTPTLETTLPDNVFGEGSVLLGDKIYVLTWVEGRCLVYNPATFENTGEFAYRREGWGLTTDGKKLYMSEGTYEITVRDPATFAAERTIAVRNQGNFVTYINELEWIEGKIWANVYLTNEIVIIDPESGYIEGIIDFTGIASHLEVTRETDVLNGIAYDPATKRIFVTGKRWNRLFEIEIIKK